MQTRNPLFDDLAKMATSAAGVAQGMGEEVRTFWRSQMERMIADMDLVTREEFDAVKQLAASARAEADALKARLDALEGSSASKDGAAPKPARAKKSDASPA
ncbi:MAG: accessory factor UbiK family protein [Hyphomonadaceae bacterium]|jgi:BMFP domain-containing protein YqiC|nr:accessory factor UbiK family protein [Hyphomonadaceae bacterium]